MKLMTAKQNNKIKAIVFDVDGVLIHSKDSNGDFYWKKTIREDLGISKEQTKLFFKDYWTDVGAGKIDTLDAIDQFLKSISSKLKPEDFLNYWHEKDSNINIDTINFVKELKDLGFKLYIGTNQEKYRTNHLWNKLRFKNLFDEIFPSYKVGFEKPDIYYFKFIEESLNLTGEQIIFIDDTEKIVSSALSLNWNAFLHTDVTKTKEFVYNLIKT